MEEVGMRVKGMCEEGDGSGAEFVVDRLDEQVK